MQGTTVDVLSNQNSIAVQKSQQGGGSIILRGMEASRVLLVVDGIRMNNLILSYYLLYVAPYFQKAR